ncbi:hypothetical protein DIPPA_05064 [Diplonema papillatum]|nr:hypothetical protein DIPPA_16915 [Diplonema papillatum]KAJ9436824.1 hypothetical protein DIPPA_05064 [Diplonema papillatum]|eukprot:gene12478-19309_t
MSDGSGQKRERADDAGDGPRPKKRLGIGGLKLKGSAMPVAGAKKKKKPEPPRCSMEAAEEEDKETSEVAARAPVIDKRTDAELRFEANRRDRLKVTSAETAKLSYRERIQKENVKYANMSEFHDIPKVTYRTNK